MAVAHCAGIHIRRHPPAVFDPFSCLDVAAAQGTVLAGLLRKTTSLVGLAACEGPHESLRVSYTKILDVLEQIPKNATCSKHIEWITNEKWVMVKAEPDVENLEDPLQGHLGGAVG
ncbi:NADH dehydrogenase [ubiquinone] 1 alpha subcomplex subunit 5-like [Panthera uncia]|uniref:NADH dehydrogenase [ubiquinone] 1 alpha subcomplex subunit 5-like n=1 Tax=Panthera uncia TaxID=29064 RepID=UPI0020FFE463|nr:NADH dehydrogenase [ubiquinone] 1 alpha subcomplex subunit 5-like [Panthera uncia]